MRKAGLSIDDVKRKIDELKGKNLSIRLNKGRNKICFLKGVISETYSSVFVMNVRDSIMDRVSCSYQDVLCGDVKFREV